MNTVADLSKLKSIWLDLWHKQIPAGGIAQLWLEAVLIYLEQRGDQVIPAELIKAEQKLIEMGLGEELFAALSDGVKPDLGQAHDIYARTYELLHATTEDRYDAIKEVKRV